MKNIKVGQEVWFKSTWTSVNSGIVTEICDGKAEGYVMLKGTRETYGSTGAKIDDCYTTKEELLQALQAEHDNKVKNYCQSIQTVEDLVRFCYDHNFTAEEYTDWEAKKAAEIRAKELLDITLNDY